MKKLKSVLYLATVAILISGLASVAFAGFKGFDM